jgi:exopolysaccharide biosynthesis polyprenyl glycosylphosphotransferase
MAASQVTTQNPSAFGDFLPSPVAAGYRAAHAAGLRELLAVFFGAAERCVDGLAIVAGVYCALALYRLLGWGSQVQYPASTVLLASAGFALLFMVLLERHGGYRPYVGLLAVRDTERILRVTVESLLLALLAAYFATERISRLVVLLALVTVPIVVIFAKWETRRALHLLRAKGYGARRAVIVGAGTLGRRMYSALVRSPKFGLDPVAFVDDDPQLQGVEIYESSYRRRRATKVFAGPVSPGLLRELDASVLVIATPGMDREVMVKLAAAAGVDTYCVREDFSEPGLWIDYAEFDGITLAHFSRGQTRIAGDVAKCAMDLAISALLLVLLTPLFAVVASLVKMSSPGPALFRQERVGKDGRLFSICKFRTMYCDAPQYSCSPGAGDDPRVTPFGRFLRRTSLDELPQLLNVLLGHMSLVGPRPEMPFIVEQYTPLQRRRLSVKPGITGLWQLSADRSFPIHENIEYDLYYLTNNPLFLWNIALQFSGIKRFEMKAAEVRT